MNSLLFSVLLLLGCASAAPEVPKEEPKPAPKEEPKPEEPKPAPKEDPKPEEPKEEPKPEPPKEEPKPEPKKEEAPAAPIPPPPPKTSPEAMELLQKAAKRQGTDGFVGGLAPTRFQASFATVLLHGEGGSRAEFTDSVESFALPVPGAREVRMRSSVVADGKRIVLGHNGRFGWSWTKDLKTAEETLRRFTDKEKYAEDIKDLDARRRMLRLGHTVFFLGPMAEGPVPVALLPDEERKFPLGKDGKGPAVKCRVLERAAIPGEPGIRIYLDAGSLDPVAVVLLPPAAGEASFLLTVAFDAEDVRAKRAYPRGVRVPDWLEMYEVPADPERAPALRIQAGFKGLEIDAAKVPDALFEVPAGK